MRKPTCRRRWPASLSAAQTMTGDAAAWAFSGEPHLEFP